MFQRLTNWLVPLPDDCGSCEVVVYVNDVEVGRLQGDEYALLRDDIVTRPWPWVQQVGSTAGALCLGILNWGAGTLKLAGVLLVATALLAPENVTQLLANVSQSSEGVLREVASLLALSALFCAIGWMLVVGFGARAFALPNVFTRQLARRLRMYLKVPADGDVEWVIRPVTPRENANA